MQKPLITIITVCRNNAIGLEKTIRSVAAQTYQETEYIVIDGASTDDTPDIIKDYSGNISQWVSEPDKGIYDAMNKGIRMAHGEWTIFMNASDTFASDDTLQQVFSRQQDADVIYGDVIKGNHVKKAEPPHNAHRMFFCHQSAFVRTTCLRQYPFDTNHRMSADFKQIKQLYLAGKQFHQEDFPIARFDTTGISNTSRSAGLFDNISVIAEVDGLSDKIRLLPRLFFTWCICRLRGK